MNGNSKPYAILVFGAPMSGKSSFAQQFSKRFSAPFLNISELHAESRISRKTAMKLAAEIAKSKQTMIVEGGLDTEKQRNEMKRLFLSAGYLPVLIWVQTDLTAIKHRMRQKYSNLADAKAALESSYSKLEAPADSENAIVISGKHTFQTQCKNVLSGISERSGTK